MKNYKAALFLFFSLLFFSCSVNGSSADSSPLNASSTGKSQITDVKNKASQTTALGTSNSKFLDQAYITQSLDFALYNAWISLDEALSLKSAADTSEKYNSNQIQEKIATCQNLFLQVLEKEKKLKPNMVADSIYGIQNQLKEMEKACLEQDAKELARLVTTFYISKGLVYQKSGTIFMQLIISMSLLLILIIMLLLFYQFTYARRNEIEKILKATNKGQEEERRRLALELHDSVAQQMRYVSILAEKIEDKELAGEIKKNQTDCIENIRNACYTLSSINMDKGSFTAALKNAVDSFQRRAGINTSLVITEDADFDVLPQLAFHHLFRIIMELLSNIEKHSGAKEVTVLIRNPSESDRIRRGLMIFITDDGHGLDPKTLEMMNSRKITSIKNLHFGIQNIKLRLNEIGGSIKYFSESGEGTEVEICIGK
ncbi:MAG: hypothetical protein IJ688_11805 [Treponema sp.]|nr:hypothetical protein [Treponema sp.]